MATFLEPKAMASLFGRAGIGDGIRVVVYSAGEDVLGATLVAYSLLRIGHSGVMIMDGGFDDYAARHPLTQRYPDEIEIRLSAPSPDPSLFISHQEVRAALDQTGVVLLDARPAPFYLGNQVMSQRNGHLPGALSFDWHQLTHAGASTPYRNAHRIQPLDVLHEHVDATGIAATDDLIVYCGASREASLLFLVLRYVLGYPRVRLYEGAMAEWSALEDYPIETVGRIVQPTPLSLTITGRAVA